MKHIGTILTSTDIFLLFLILKLTNTVSWDWIYVVSPILVSWSVWLIMGLFFTFVSGIAYVVCDKNKEE
jgi:hypothetical protein